MRCFLISTFFLFFAFSANAQVHEPIISSAQPNDEAEARLLEQFGAAIDLIQGKKTWQNTQNIFGEIKYEYTGTVNWQVTFDDKQAASFRMLGEIDDTPQKIYSINMKSNQFPIHLFEQKFNLTPQTVSNNIERFGNVDGAFLSQPYRYHYRIPFKKQNNDYLLLINFSYKAMGVTLGNPMLLLESVSFIRTPNAIHEDTPSPI